MTDAEHLIENYIYEMAKGKEPEEIAEIPYIKEQLEFVGIRAEDMWAMAQHVVYSLYDGHFPNFPGLPDNCKVFNPTEIVPRKEKKND